jgi:hypothetical protein
MQDEVMHHLVHLRVQRAQIGQSLMDDYAALITEAARGEFNMKPKCSSSARPSRSGTIQTIQICASSERDNPAEQW